MKHICEYLFTDEYAKERKIVGGILGGVLLLNLVRNVVRSNKKKQQKQFLENLEPNTVHLFSMSRWKYGPTFSIPCITAELFLRLAKIPYEIHILTDFSISPTGNVPFIVYNKDVVPDSAFIMEYLTDKHVGVDLNKDLTAEQQAIGNAVVRMMTNSFRFGIYRSLFVDEHASLTPLFASLMNIPLIVAKFGVSKIRQSTIQMLNKVGHGDWTDKQYRREFQRDMESIATILGDKPFLFGENVTTFDCVVVAALSAFFNVSEFQTPEMEFLRRHAKLSAYVKRVIERAFPDLAELTSPAGIARVSQKFGL